MITINDKTQCCGCSACMSVCPRSCISMECDEEGFLYPVTDTRLCIGCNACDKVCPILSPKAERTPFAGSAFFAAYANDCNTLRQSSSGGVFSLLASQTIEEGGVVFGAAWEEDTVRHVQVKNAGELERLRGSKYVQSDVSSTLRQVNELLSEGIRVLYSGTPCEIAGLNSYIKKGKELLTTIEVACHGAPSPKALSAYLDSLKSQFSVDNIRLDFRSKESGWTDYHVRAIDGEKVLNSESHRHNIYMRGFLHELFSRPSCHGCHFKGNASHADITLADFWGVEESIPDFPASKGVSLVIVNSEKGHRLWRCMEARTQSREVNAASALRRNGSLLESTEAHPERKYFFRHLNNGDEFRKLTERCLRLRKTTKARLILGSILKRCIRWS